MRMIFCGPALLALAVPAAAHDFWIQPAMFAAPEAALVPITLFVGHAEYRQRWGVANDRVVRFDDISAAGVRDRRAEVHTDSGSEDARLRFMSRGPHILVLQSTQAFSELPAIRFNDFAKEEGLTLALRSRAANGRNKAAGRERYSRRAKTLIQVGSGDAAGDALVTKPVGLTLEIVPLRNPYAAGAGSSLPVQILFGGKPLAGALVKLTNLAADARPVAAHRSDAAGRVTFDVPRSGNWLVNTIWTIPVAGDPKADFETEFSSLTFGFSGSPR